jgi:zinc protease
MTSIPAKVLVGSLLLSFTWFAQGAINLSAPLPVDPHVKIGKLDNGLTYYIQKNARPEKKVELRLVVKAGSVLEDDDQQGLAHFTEHMAFDGSRHFKKHELITFLQSIGVKFGADLNAYTSFDETVYLLPIPTDKKENLETGFQVLEDWAQGLTMEAEAIDQERNVVLEEARLGKGAGDRMRRVLLPEVLNGSKYSERLPIGKEAILKGFAPDVIRRFYSDWYRPDLMAVIVVGDVEPEQAEKLLRAHFTKLVNPAKERPRDYAKISARAESAGLVITDKEATNNAVLIEYPIQEIPAETTIADYRQEMVRDLYTAMLGQRLQELTQQENPPFLSAYSASEPIAPGYKTFTSNAVIGRSGITSAITAVVQESERVRQFGFNAGELERAKKDMIRNVERAYSEREKSESSGFASEFTRNFLVKEPIPGVQNEYAYVTELLPGVALDEVNAYAHLKTPSNAKILVAYLGSNKESEQVPTRAQLLGLVDAAEKMPVLAKGETEVAANLMAQPPKAGKVVTEKYNKELDITELTLANGVKVILKSTDFKNDQILISATRFGGQSLFEDKDVFNARYANSVVSGMGLNSFTPTELTKILAGKSVSLHTSSGNYTDSIDGSSGSADIESLFQLLYLQLTSPRKDENLFKAFINNSQDWAKDNKASPESVFYDLIQTTIYNNHPRLALMPKPEDFSHVELDRALAIYHERFSSAKDLTFVIVGSFELDKIKPLIATYLASLPTSEIAATYRDLGVRPVSGVVKKEVRTGTEQKSIVSITFTGTATYSQEENKRLRMLLEVMNNRVIDILREKLSLIYSGGMSGVLNRIPYGNYRIDVNLPCAPENVDKVIAAAFAEVEKIKTDGPQQSDTDKVKLNWIKQYRIAMRTNSKWLGAIKDSILYGTDMAEILSEEKFIDSITTEDVKATAKRYFNTGNYVQAVMYPEK